MQPDPLGLGAADLTNPQSLNRYSYVGNDPVNRVDPSGLYYVAVYGKACVSIVGSGEGSCEDYLIGLIWVGDTGGGYDYSGSGGGNSGAGEYGGGGGGQDTGPNVGFLPPHDVIGNKWYPKIKDMLNGIFGSDTCRQAFTDAGLDLEALGRKGFVIGSSTLLTDHSISDAQLGLTSAARQAAAQRASSTYGLTVMLNSGSDQRPRLFFTQAAFSAGGLFSSAADSFRQVLIHELIHAAGAPGKGPGWWGYLGYDDLGYMQKQYGRIKKACGSN